MQHFLASSQAENGFSFSSLSSPFCEKVAELSPHGATRLTTFEGMEAVVFVGGVSLGQPATSISIAAIVGIIAGLVVGFAIYSFASRSSEFPRT